MTTNGPSQWNDPVPQTKVSPLTGGLETQRLDYFERGVLKVARHFFEAFANPESQAWISAFRHAEQVFQAPFGATIGHAVLIAINELRASRQNPFHFEMSDSVFSECSMTDGERYFILVLHHIREANVAAARANALLICEGNDTSGLLAALERLAIITGDVGELHFNNACDPAA